VTGDPIKEILPVRFSRLEEDDAGVAAVRDVSTRYPGARVGRG
jgi:hypothetical protein